MATYSIKAPNGQTYEIDGPDGATQEQVQAEVLRQFPEAGGGAQAEVAAPTEAPANPELPADPAQGERVANDYGWDPENGLIVNVTDDRPEEPITPTDDSALTGFLAGVAKPFIKGGEFLSNIPVIGPLGDRLSTLTGAPTSAEEMAQNEQTRANNSRTGWQTAGTITGTLPTLAIPGGSLVQGAAAGALSTDAHDFGGVAKDALIGGAVGRAGDAVAGLIAPRVSPMVRRLLDEGVRLTPGQILGQSGTALGRTAKVAEDVIGSVPIAGAAVRAAQERGVQDLNSAAINRALRPIGQRLPRDLRSGNDAVAYAGDRLRDAYADVLPRLSGTLDQTFATRIATIRNRANLPPEYAQMLDNAQTELSNAFTRAGPNGTFSGRTLRDTSERLNDLASAWRRSDDPYVRVVGDTAEQFRQQLHALARRQNPSAARRLRDIDRGYASLVRVEKAAAGTADGAFTPAQYQSATRMTDRSARRRASARGQALDQDLSSAANVVMTSRAAQGGSKDVNSLLALGAGAGAALSGSPLAMGGAALIGGGSLAYTQPVQAALRAAIARNPSATENVLSQIVRYGNRAVAPGAAATISSLPD